MEELAFALDTFYAVMAGALVMFMAAGFTMLEAGLVQKKDVSEIVTKNIGLYSIACIMYLACGFVIMYPGSYIIEGVLPSIFGTSSFGLSTSLPNEDIGMPYGMDYSQQADFFFQVVFVATAMSIVSGAVAGRMKLLPFYLFAIVLTGLIYPIQGAWNWGGGFLSSMGYSDYAGSGTVHLCGAAAALAVVMVLGPRNGKYAEDGTSLPMPGSNIPMAALGVWILWLGWFGFNGGSELIVSNESAAIAVSQVFMNTNMAACGGVVAAILMSLVFTKKNGCNHGNEWCNCRFSSNYCWDLALLQVVPAVLIGAAGGALVYFSILFFDKTLKLDDPVGAISAHGVVGILGVMVVPLTSDASFVDQATGVLSIAGFTFLASLGTILVINKFMPIRATDEEQYVGLDSSEIGVEAYPEF
jgi:Amt family ammonium transporter